MISREPRGVHRRLRQRIFLKKTAGEDPLIGVAIAPPVLR
jgi:hypothetical protein